MYIDYFIDNLLLIFGYKYCNIYFG